MNHCEDETGMRYLLKSPRFLGNVASGNGFKMLTAALCLLAVVLTVIRIESAEAQRPDGERIADSAGTTSPTTVLYQGYVTVGDSPYDSTGYFKFAITDAAGNHTYWSNDGTSGGGSEPVSAVHLSVSEGYFTVLLGDTSLSGMTRSMSPSVFDEAGRHLRVWFGQSGYGPFTQLSLVPMAAVPYALNADTLDGQDSDSFAQSSHDHWGAQWSGSGLGLLLDSSSGTALAAQSYGSLPIGTAIYGENHGAGSSAGFGVEGYSSDGIGTVGESDVGTGLVGVSGYGMIDQALRDDVVDRHAGVYGYSEEYGPGGFFIARDGHGVESESYDLDGVHGRSSGRSMADNGLYGETNSTYLGEAGVYGGNNGQGPGVYGRGIYTDTGHGMRSSSAHAHAVYADSNSTSYSHYGGYFRGPQGVYATSENPNSDAITARCIAGGACWGLDAHSDSAYGIHASTGDSGGNYGLYTRDNIYSGGYHSSSGFSLIAQNGSNRNLERGDLVSVRGMTDPLQGSDVPLLTVQAADGSTRTDIVGVVGTAYEITRVSKPEVVFQETEIADPEGDETEVVYVSKTVDREVPMQRAVAGPVKPGGLMVLRVEGVAQVKANTTTGPIQVGDPLVPDVNGEVIELQAALVEGTTSSYASDMLIGKALEPLTEGSSLLWVLLDL